MCVSQEVCIPDTNFFEEKSPVTPDKVAENEVKSAH